MDPANVIASALAAGAAAALKETTGTAIRDAYAAFKGFLLKRCSQPLELEHLERKPESLAKRGSIAEDLTAAGVAQDGELLEAANRLLQLVERCQPGTASSMGVKLDQVLADRASIRRVRVEHGTGVAVSNSTFQHLEIDDVDTSLESTVDPKA